MPFRFPAHPVWTLVATLALALLLSGCSIPKLSPKGKTVRLMAGVDDSLKDCQTYTPFRVKAKSITSKDAQKRRNIIARNNAAKAGANVVVPLEKANEKGQQEFTAFRCEQPQGKAASEPEAKPAEKSK